MGYVWRVKNSLGDEGALKAISEALTSDHTFVHRFQSEIQTLRRISHPSVISILDWGQDHASNAWYFVMPFIKGVSLRRKIKEQSLTEEQIKAITLSLAEGLKVCHSEQIIHRDIKPENIMLLDDLTPILIDFGIAHHELSTGHTSLATGGYAPPEQQAGRPIDHTADLFALSMTIAECLGERAARPPWVKILNKLTHIIPSQRGSAQELIEALSPRAELFLAHGQERTEALTLHDAVERLMTWGEDAQVYLWTKGMSTWSPWREHAPLLEAVSAHKKAQEPALSPPSLPPELTPPPLPPLRSEDSDPPLSTLIQDLEGLFDEDDEDLEGLFDEDDEDDEDDAFQLKPSRLASDSESDFEPIQEGTIVRVLKRVSEPKYGWGSVSHHSIGVVTSVTGEKAKVDFEEQSSWSAHVDELESLSIRSDGSTSEVLKRLKANAGHWASQVDVSRDKPSYFNHFYILLTSNNNYIANGSIIKGSRWDQSNQPKFQTVHGYSKSDGEWHIGIKKMVYLGPTWRDEWTSWSDAYTDLHGDKEGKERFDHEQEGLLSSLFKRMKRKEKPTSRDLSDVYSPSARRSSYEPQAMSERLTQPGSLVRVKRSVKTPRYQWGNARPGMVGKVHQKTDKMIKVDFEELSSYWNASVDDLELVSSDEDWVRADYDRYCHTPRGDRDKMISKAAKLRLSAWRSLADRGDGEACFLMGKHHDDLFGITEDEAIKYYRKGVEAGEPYSCTNLANHVSSREARALRKRAAELGSWVAADHVAESLLFGRSGFTRDIDEAIKYLKLAAKNKERLALKERDWTTSKADYEKVKALSAYLREDQLKSLGRFDQWKSAADEGCHEACYLVGKCYQEGVLVERNRGKAKQYYKSGCMLGNPFCMTNYANEFADSEDELTLYEAAAMLGSYAAAHNFLVTYSGSNQRLKAKMRRLKDELS